MVVTAFVSNRDFHRPVNGTYNVPLFVDLASFLLLWLGGLQSGLAMPVDLSSPQGKRILECSFLPIFLGLLTAAAY
jgi:hypothetical protein